MPPPGKVTGKCLAKNRVSLCPEYFRADGDILICIACNRHIDHVKKDTVMKHLKGVGHLKAAESRNREGGDSTVSQNILAVFAKTTAQEANATTIERILRLFVGLNIPLKKLDQLLMRDFLMKDVKNGGCVPGSVQMMQLHVPRIFQGDREVLKEKLKDKEIALQFDELPDNEDRSVLNVLATDFSLDESGGVKYWLLDTIFLDGKDHATLAAEVIKVVGWYDIPNSKVISVTTDNASVCYKAYREIMSHVYTNSVHIGCIPHMLNLAVKTMKTSFPDVALYFKTFNALFFKSGARKKRFVTFMKTKSGSETFALPPNPCGKSWDRWLMCAKYHHENFQLCRNWIAQEILQQGRKAIPSLKNISKMIEKANKAAYILAQVRFIAIEGEGLLKLMKHMEGQKPNVMGAIEKVNQQMDEFTFKASRAGEMVSFCFTPDFVSDHLSLLKQRELTKMMAEGYKRIADKFDKYFGPHGVQPALKFLQAMRVADPRNLQLIARDYGVYKNNLPGFTAVDRTEFHRYVQVLGPEAVKNIIPNDDGDRTFDIGAFWNSMKRETMVPSVATYFQNRIRLICSSATVERSFSAYNLILSDHRRGLTCDKIRQLNFLYFNKL